MTSLRASPPPIFTGKASAAICQATGKTDRRVGRRGDLLAMTAISLVLLSQVPAQSMSNDQILSSSTVSLSEVLRVAERENPEITAARKKWDAARARIAQETTPEKPRLDIERMYVPKNDAVFAGTGEKNWAVTQEVPFPTTLYLRNRRAREEAAMAEAGFRAKERDVLARVKAAYAMLYLSHHSIHIFQENADLMRQFAQAANARYAAGTAMQIDVLKAQVELSKMLNMLVTLEQEKQTNEAMLNTLLNRPPESALGIPEDPPLQYIKQNLESLQALAVKERPDLQEAARAVDRSRTSLNLARSEYLPDLMLQYRRRDMMNGPETHDAVVGFSVPLWFWKQGAMVREARADREMAQAEYQFMKNMTLFDVKNLLVRVNTAQRLTELYQTSVLPQAQQALKVSQAGYQSGRLPFLDLLDAARSLLSFRLEQYGHIADYEQNLADLERAVGVNLGETK